MTVTKQSLIIIVLGLLCSDLSGQSVMIHGEAPDFKGQEISAFGYTDHISQRKEWLSRSMIDSSGGFQLEFPCSQIRYIGIRAGHVTGFLYAQPDGHYDIEFPPPLPEVSITFNDKAQTDVVFKNLDLADINSLIIDFNERYEGFFAQNYDLLKRLFSPSNKAMRTDSIKSLPKGVGKNGMEQLMDRMESFISRMDTVYKDYENPYFKTYRTAALGDLLLNGPVTDRKAFFERFIAPVPMNLFHKAQTELELRFFNDYFLNFTRSRGDDELGRAMNVNGSYTALFTLLSKDDFLMEHVRRDRVIAAAISEIWSNKSLDKQKLASVLDSVGFMSNDERTSRLGDDVLYVLSSMDDGFPAYDFQLKDQFHDALNLSRFKGTPVILEFWASWCTSCEKEKAVFKSLAEAYKGKVQFISINMDDQPEHEEENHNLILDAYGLDDPMLKETYQVMTLPQYTLIDEDGLIYDAHTLTPSEGLESFLIPLTRNEQKPSRPAIGSKEN